MTDFITEIKERRILPAVGVYAAGSWVLIEILDRLVERYLLSPYLTDLFFWGLYSLIPAVILVAWSYGRPGKDKATTAQKVGVPINIIATLGLLITVFGGKDLGAAANMITVNNEEGQVETHYVPTETYRRRLAVFFFDNTSGDPQLDWLQFGMTNLLVQDLQQDPFIAATDPWVNWGNGFYLRMQRADFDTGLDIPRSLMRDIADSANRQHFIDGEIGSEGGETIVTARIWDTRTLQSVGEVRARGWDIYKIADELSDGIKQALDVPSGNRISQSLPLSETYGESEEAFKAFIQALNMRLFDNNIQGALALLDRALKEDPNFVLAWFMKGMFQFEGGDLPAAQAAFQKASEMDYRLPERDRALLKQAGYRLAGENDKVLALMRMQVELRGDAASYTRLAIMLMVTGEPEEAKQQFLAALEKDPMNTAIYLNLSQLERSMGNMPGAVGYAKRFQKEKPEDTQAHIALGDLLRDTGELEEAGESYLQAQLLADSPVVPLLRLAELAARNGNIAEARSLIEEAEAAAETPLEYALVREGAARLEYRLGRLHAAVEQINAQYEHVVQALPPMAVAIAIYDTLVRAYLDLGDDQNAEISLDKGKALLQPPMDQFLAFSEAQIHLRRGDLVAAEASIGSGQQIIDQFDFDALQFQVFALRGELMEQRGDYAAAAELLVQSIESFKQSFISGQFAVFLPVFYAHLARVQIYAGLLDDADRSINEGMRLDPNQPLLWLVKARHQAESGMHALAAASVQYALAIWSDADPDYLHYAHAADLAEEIANGGG